MFGTVENKKLTRARERERGTKWTRKSVRWNLLGADAAVLDRRIDKVPQIGGKLILDVIGRSPRIGRRHSSGSCGI